MEHAALIRAIREPAVLYGGEVSRELAERLIADAGGGQDQLPLIQHGLMLLWRRRRRRCRLAWQPRPSAAVGLAEAPATLPPRRRPGLATRLADYRDVGGLAALLSDHADEVIGAGGPTHEPAEDRRGPVPGADRDQRRGPGHPSAADLRRADGDDRQRRADAAGRPRRFRADGVSFLNP